MKCKSCGSTSIAEVCSKSSDLNSITIGTYDIDGYVPDNIGIGGGDYIIFDYCLNCGQIQGEFPIKEIDITV